MPRETAVLNANMYQEILLDDKHYVFAAVKLAINVRDLTYNAFLL